VLKSRILTAIVLMLIVALFLLQPYYLVFFIGSLCLLGIAAWEWSRFILPNSRAMTIFYPIITLCFAGFSYFLPMAWILLMGFVWWLVAIVLIFRFPKEEVLWHRYVILRCVIGWLILIPFFVAINFARLQPNYLFLMMYILFMVWSADTGAYFAGKKFGRRKLASRVSPKKTWEGFFGGVLLCLLCMGLFGLFSGNTLFFEPQFMGLSFLMIVFSVVGDLTESIFKRFARVKDSSHLLPGHGGVLDRIDSLTAAFPIFMLGLWIMQWI
jgi:phosphatidate cytidylyltransferase